MKAANKVRLAKFFTCNYCNSTHWKVVKGIFGIREWPYVFPVKCETASFFS